ncbi:MAG: nucleotide sugar dehydrogenase [Blastocatellia bacterium]|jgi:UDP-N-acetyl-D-mannosaminuronic acid dehydrogenase
MSTKNKIVVIGAGYVGLPAALMWASAGKTVIAVDINEKVVRAINEGIVPIHEPELQDLLRDERVQRNLVAQDTVTEGDVFVIAVPTPIDPLKKVADLRHVISAVESICPHLRPGNLILVESTVPPLTCRNLLRPLIEKLTGLSIPGDLSLAYCPERILPGNIFHEIVHNDRIIGGIDKIAGQQAAELYNSFVKGQLFQTDDLSAELAKLFENTYRDVNIALANEFASICDDLDLNVRGVIELANRHPRVNILKPGIGVGGHCIPFAPWFLHEIAPYNSRLITTGRLINDEMPGRVAGKIRRAVRFVADPAVVLIGATYKRNSEDVRESPGIRVFDLLKEDGYRVSLYDPFIPDWNYGSIVEVARDADLLGILVAHDTVVSELRESLREVLGAMRTPQVIFFDE